MKPLAFSLLSSGLLMTGVIAISLSRADEPVGFQDGMRLVQKYNCQQCHEPYKALTGPSFHDIAKRYENDPHARNDLGTHIVNGSVGAWGPAPMPAVPVAKEDVRPLVDFILSLTH